MADKWAYVIVYQPGSGDVSLSVHHPGKNTVYINGKDYLRSCGGVLPRAAVGSGEVLPYLLQDGWEPFAVDTHSLHLKKKVG